MYKQLSDEELIDKYGPLLGNKALTAVCRQTLPQDEVEPTDSAKVFALAQRNRPAFVRGMVKAFENPSFA